MPVRGLLVGLLLLLIAAPEARAGGAEHRFPVQDAAKAYPETWTVRLRFAARNEGNGLLEGAHFWAYLPVRQTATQRLLEVVSSHPGELTHDELGNSVLRVDVGRVPPHGSAMVTVTATLGIADPPARVKRSPGKGGPDLEPAPFIEVSDPAIAKQAALLRRDEAPDTARAIYTWVSRTVKDAGFTARDRGALWALETQRGDCSEMAYLFVALARAAGLPARYLSGWVVESSALLTPEAFHNWAEWHDGKTWRVADPQKQVFDDRPQRFIATNISGAPDDGPMAGSHRFRSGTEGLDVRMLGRR